MSKTTSYTLTHPIVKGEGTVLPSSVCEGVVDSSVRSSTADEHALKQLRAQTQARFAVDALLPSALDRRRVCQQRRHHRRQPYDHPRRG
jgi:hypothetical protein